MDTFTKNEVIHMMELQAQHIDESFESLFEVLQLTPQQIESFHLLCNDKMHDRRDKEAKTADIFMRLLHEKEDL